MITHTPPTIPPTNPQDCPEPVTRQRWKGARYPAISNANFPIRFVPETEIQLCGESDKNLKIFGKSKRKRVTKGDEAREAEEAETGETRLDTVSQKEEADRETREAAAEAEEGS